MAKLKRARKPVKKAAGPKSELDLGPMIRKMREGANVSQEELAFRLQTKRTAISRIENHAEDIKISTLERVAKALGKELRVRFG